MTTSISFSRTCPDTHACYPSSSSSSSSSYPSKELSPYSRMLSHKYQAGWKVLPSFRYPAKKSLLTQKHICSYYNILHSPTFLKYHLNNQTAVLYLYHIFIMVISRGCNRQRGINIGAEKLQLHHCRLWRPLTAFKRAIKS